MGNSVSQEDLAKYQPKGSYALATDLAKYQPKGDYTLAAPKGDQYTLKSYTDATYQPKGNYALASDLAKYQPKGDYALVPQGDKYALKSYADSTYLAQTDFKKFGQDYIKFTESVPSTYVQRDTFNALSNSLSPPKGDQYALKSYTDATYQPKGSYATQNDIENLSRVVEGVFKDLDSRVPRQTVPTVVSATKGPPILPPLSPQEGLFTMNYITVGGDSVSIAFKRNGPVPNIVDSIVAFNANNSIPGIIITISYMMEGKPGGVTLNYKDSNETSGRGEMKGFSIDMMGTPCGGYKDTDTNVSDTCMMKLWSDAGCVPKQFPVGNTVKDWKGRTLTQLKGDMDFWANTGPDWAKNICHGSAPPPSSRIKYLRNNNYLHY